MAFPVVEGTAETAVATASTSHPITLPASIISTDLVLITMDIGSTSATMNSLTDWGELLDESSANGLKIWQYTGAGVPSNPTFTSSAATRSASIAWRISGVDKTVTPQIGTTATAASATPDPPASAAPPLEKDYLYIAFYGATGEEADDDTWSDTPPTNYLPSPPLQKACGTAGTNLGGMIAAASRQLRTGTGGENPGTFAKDVSATWRAQTITIHPSLVFAKTGSGILSGAGDFHLQRTSAKTGHGTLGINAKGNVGAPATIGFVGSGVKVYVPGASGNTYTKQNSGIAGFVGAATDAELKIETGAGALVAAGSGADASFRAETGSGILSFSGTAADEIRWTETGQGVLALSGTAADEIRWQESGSGILGASASGVRSSSVTAVKTGSGIAGLSGSAAEVQIAIETGSGVLTKSGSAVKAAAFAETGSGVLRASAAGGDVSAFGETGTGILGAVGSGAKIVTGQGTTYAKSGIGIMGRAYVPAITKTGAGILSFVGSGSKLKVSPGKSGSGISGFSAAGVRAMIYVEADAGGGDAPEPPALESDHPANIVFSASGVKTLAAGSNTYVKQSSGILGLVGSGSDVSTRIETGTGILAAVGSGSKQVGGGATNVKSGVGISGFSASAADFEIKVEAGAGILGLSGGASHSATRIKAGTGIISFVGSGAKQALLGATYTKTGSGVLTATASGVRQRIRVRSGSGVLDLVGQGRDVVSWSKRGSGILSMTATGERKYGVTPGSVSVVDQGSIALTLQEAPSMSLAVEDSQSASLVLS